MTTYNTGNPVGSVDPKDLYDNAQNLDNIVNGSEHSYADRLGVARRSLAGIDAAADAVLSGLGYAPPVTYAAGISLTLTTQTVEYNGEVYAPKLSALPFTTGGTFDPAKFRIIQGVPSAYLAAPGGAELVGADDGASGSLWTTVAGLIAFLLSSLGASVIGFIAAGVGAVRRSMQDKARDFVNALDYGLSSSGSAVLALTKAATAVRQTTTDTTGRTMAGTVYLPPGVFTIDDALALAPANGVTGLTIKGAGRGATVLLLTQAASTISAVSSSFVTFQDLTLRGAGIDTEQSAFTINQTGTPLRSWTYERVVFEAFFKCFAVTGTSMCSEFFFKSCSFLGCYHLMDNSNDQAVNWNFDEGCIWENESMVTTKDKNLAAAFKLQKGTFVKWNGGSLIFHGMLAYFNLTSANSFSRTAHKLAFSGVRIELEDLSGTHAPLVGRPASGYSNGGNSPTLSISDFTILNRGAIPTTVDYFQVWGNCSLALTNGECEGGRIVGILDSVTAASQADVRVTDVRGVDYAENTTSRVNTHDSHVVRIDPDLSTAGTQMITDMRSGGLTLPASAFAKRLFVRGPTGSLPNAGTTVNLPAMRDHTALLELFLFRFQAAGQAITVELKDQADTTVYATMSLTSAESSKKVSIGKEVGFQIPSGTALMLKFTGTAEVVKGVVGLEYL